MFLSNILSFCATIKNSAFKGAFLLRFLKSSSIGQSTILVIIFAAIFAMTSAFVVIYSEKKEMDRQILDMKKSYSKAEEEKLFLLNSRVIKVMELLVNDKLLEKELNLIINAALKSKNSFIFILNEDKKFLYNSSSLNEDDLLEKISNSNKEGFLELNFKDQQATIYVSFLNDYMIGVGSFLKDLDSLVANKKEESHKKITAFILKISTLTLVLYLVGILKYRYLTKEISKDLKLLDNSFKDAPKSYDFIDEKLLSFEEFKEISLHANKMIAKIREKNRDLTLLNTNLEKMVEEKTSELKESNRYTKELLKQQDHFVNNAIHEINTPLSIMLTNIELHNLKMPKSPYLTKIEAAVKVLENIYEDLGYIVKKQRTSYPKEFFDMSEFLTQRVAYFHDVAEGNDLTFKAKIKPNIKIYFSPVELQRVIDNNLSNAIKYAQAKSEIELELLERDEYIYFVISNLGKPIKEPMKLFQRYYREHEARGGFGLGLNIVKEICDENSVKIIVDSKDGKIIFSYIFQKGE